MVARTGCWIAVASADHVAAGVRHGLFACSHGRGEAAARPRNGDRFAYYAPRATFEGRDPLQAFVALGRITDDAPTPRDFDGLHAAVRSADYQVVATAPVRPLLPRLEFVRDKGSHWGMAFRQGLFVVAPEDFAVIEAALTEARGG